jgi:hypothetical protein
MSFEFPSEDTENTGLIATIIEAVFGLAGALGMGWLYVGEFGKAALIFTGYLIFCLLEAFLTVVTIGMAGICLAPLNVLAIAISSIKLREMVRETGATGSFLYVLIAFILVVGLVFLLVAGIFFFVVGGGLE